MTQLKTNISVIELKICEIMSNIVKDTDGISITLGSKLLDLGIDSLTFIEVIVEIENEFGIEFGEEKLNQKEFESVQEIAKYVWDLL